jgi:UDP-N-acetylglucosamine 2-epimerase (non-hydrolysing)
LAPLVLALRENLNFETRLCVTAQHRDMLDQVLDLFGLSPDFDLNIMTNGQDLADITTSVLHRLREVFTEYRPDITIVQGDTSTTFAATLSSFYHQVPTAHVEAGLRTGCLRAPWPEEANRKLTTTLTSLHFAPTERARTNLLGEGVCPHSVHVTGNTVIDALFLMRARLKDDNALRSELDRRFAYLSDDKRIVLVTGHRRENFGPGFERICQALAYIADRHPEIEMVYPVHLNPNVQSPVRKLLGGTSNIHLIEPLAYLPFVYLMNRSFLVLTDSGGIQEEAPSLGKPVLVMRETTERPEAVEAGTVKLVGTNPRVIVAEVERLLTDQDSYARMSIAHNPYGDGRAVERIISVLAQRA